MRVFISSTAYDLSDARDLVAESLHSAEHAAVHHENATFPNYTRVHSHDRCILAVATCDALACIVDRRYGGTYSGTLRANTPAIELPQRGGGTPCLSVQELSITWMEVLEARQLGIPVMTFARQKTLDELEIWKRNRHLKSLKMVHVPDDQRRLFDFLSWTTHQQRDNWIEKYTTLTELRERVLAWIRSVSATAPLPPSRIADLSDSSSLPAPLVSLVLFVEGQSDAHLARSILELAKLALRVDIVPFNGKAKMLGNIRSVAAVHGLSYDKMMFLFDADTEDETAAEAERMRAQTLLDDMGFADRAHALVAVPDTDAWRMALRMPAGRGRRRAEKEPLEQARLDVAMSASPSLAGFLTTLRECAGGHPVQYSDTDYENGLLLRAKLAASEHRRRGGSTVIEVTFDLASTEDINAALRLEEKGKGHVIEEDGRWRFRYTDKAPVLEDLYP